MSEVGLIVEGRIATLAGEAGFGWVEAIAIEDGRIVAAGSRDEVDGLAGPRTRRLELGPDEVGIPGLNDSHLHLSDAAMAATRVDLAGAASVDAGLDLVAAGHAALADPDAWLEGQGWDAEGWGRWPTADELERVAPGRRAVFWAHDHHSYWVSSAALADSGVSAATIDPDGGVVRRDADGRPSGVLHETAARLVSVHVPAPTVDRLSRAIEALSSQLVARGVVGAHDPGGLTPEPDLELGFVAYAVLADAGRLPLRIHACIREEALETAIRRGLRSGDTLAAGRDRAKVGWMKLFADGTLASRTAAMLEPFEPEPDRAPPPAGPLGLFFTPPDRLAELAERAATHGIATQIHAIGDSAVRACLDALEPTVGRTAFTPRLEHVQLADPLDVPRFGRRGIAASVQPVHLRMDAEPARRAWGARAETNGYPWRSLVAGGALIPFGTDAPVEPWDPWPGLELAVTRRDPSWPSAVSAFGPQESLSLERAIRAICLDPPRTAGEMDRGRLVVGHRADLVVIPAPALGEPVEVGGPLGTARPRLVLVDGVVAMEA